ncbi:hypothetical protein JCM5350_002164 [Sporobolomyces pararoseus]
MNYNQLPPNQIWRNSAESWKEMDLKRKLSLDGRGGQSKSSLMVEITLTSRDRMYKVGSARAQVLGGLQLGINLDLGVWRELTEMIIYL